MEYKRTRSFNNPIIIVKAIKRISQQLNANPRQERSNQHDEGKGGKPNKNWTNDKGIFWVTVALMFGTFIVAWEAVHQSSIVENEFEVSTTPYLQIGHVRDTLKIGQSFDFNLQIENLGKDPTKIIRGNFRVQLTNRNENLFIQTDSGMRMLDELGKEFFKLKADTLQFPINSYAINGSPYNGECRFHTILDTAIFDDVMHGRRDVIFYGEIDYINLFTKANRTYTFQIIVFYYPTYKTQFIVNEN